MLGSVQVLRKHIMLVRGLTENTDNTFSAMRESWGGAHHIQHILVVGGRLHNVSNEGDLENNKTWSSLSSSRFLFVFN